MNAKKSLHSKASQIRLIIFDVDGVLTNGGLYFSDEGHELKRFNSLDGHGIKMIQEFAIEPAVISARSTKTVEYRMANLGVKHFYQGQENKLIAYKELISKLNLKPQQVAYMGDDVLDLPVMLNVGLPIAVANAHDLVKKNSAFVTKKAGGDGAVREVCDMLLKSQNNYDKAMERYLS